MDGEAFDRLSVAVHRLRDQATRRGALRVLLGGSVVAATGLLGHDAEAKKKKKKKNKKNNCRGYGGRCKKNGDCCYGKCRNGWCYYNGGGGGGGGNKNCGGRKCPSGWGCRNQGGVSVCVPKGYPTYCGGDRSWKKNYHCCTAYGVACGPRQECCGISCCQDGWKCCGNRICIPRNWDCNDFYWQESQGAAISSESGQRIPSSEPTVSDAGSVSLDN